MTPFLLTILIWGGVHLNDITLISPVYHQDELFGYVASLVHHVDVGGGAPASIGAFREVYQEGIIIPPVKLVQGGEIVPDIFRLVLATDPLPARDGGRLSGSVGGQQYRRAPAERTTEPGGGARN